MENSEQDQQDGLSRRDMLKIGGLGGLALTATGMIGSTSSSAETQGGLSTHVAPGELDE